MEPNGPWPEDRQIEQDLIISRALVEIFKDNYLKKELRFRGGTALNKLHFPSAYRYSEDIDLTRTTEGPGRSNHRPSPSCAGAVDGPRPLRSRRHRTEAYFHDQSRG
ncbi:nucleotidyl transferase AbiEii/AbiGii toxin family protein [Bradyrhizobium sp. USDA 4501]